MVSVTRDHGIGRHALAVVQMPAAALALEEGGAMPLLAVLYLQVYFESCVLAPKLGRIWRQFKNIDSVVCSNHDVRRARDLLAVVAVDRSEPLLVPHGSATVPLEQVRIAEAHVALERRAELDAHVAAWGLRYATVPHMRSTVPLPLEQRARK